VVSRAACDCGRTALRLDRLRGRTDDMIIFKGVNFYPQQIETLLLRQPGASHEYQILLDAAGGGERMTILLEVEPGCDPDVAARIRHQLHDLLAFSPEVRLLKQGELERPQGKAVRVVDKRDVR
jgi:phenylacetate-CoA ligase